MDSGLDENESELGVLVLSVLLEVLPDIDGLLDEEVQVLWDLRGESVSLENSQNLAAGHASDLRDPVGVTKNDANLRWGHTLPSELADALGHLLGGHLEPSRWASLVGKSRRAKENRRERRVRGREG